MLTRNQINDLVIGADNLLTGERLGLMKLAPGKSTFEPAEVVAAASGC